MNMKKTLTSLLALILMLGVTVPNFASAESSGSEVPAFYFDSYEELYDSVRHGELYDLLNDDSMGTQAFLPAAAVFVGGILAGFVVDGVLISSTGFSGGQWAAITIDYLTCGRKDLFQIDREAGRGRCGFNGGGGSGAFISESSF